MYKEKPNLRIIYGKQFENIMNNHNDDRRIKPFLRYILNDTDNGKEPEKGYFSKGKQTDEFVLEYKLYTEKNFNDISKYINSVFSNNNTSYEELYSKMLIKDRDYLKGIYLFHSKHNNHNIQHSNDSNNKKSVLIQKHQKIIQMKLILILWKEIY